LVDVFENVLGIPTDEMPTRTGDPAPDCVPVVMWPIGVPDPEMDEHVVGQGWQIHFGREGAVVVRARKGSACQGPHSVPGGTGAIKDVVPRVLEDIPLVLIPAQKFCSPGGLGFLVKIVDPPVETVDEEMDPAAAHG